MDQVIDKYSELNIKFINCKKSYDNLMIKYDDCLKENKKMKQKLEKPAHIFMSFLLVYFIALNCGYLNEQVIFFVNLSLMISGLFHKFI